MNGLDPLFNFLRVDLIFSFMEFAHLGLEFSIVQIPGTDLSSSLCQVLVFDPVLFISFYRPILLAVFLTHFHSPPVTL